MLSKLKTLDEAKKNHKIGNLDKAIEIYKSILPKDSVNSEIYFLIGTAFLQKNDYEKSVYYLKSAIKLKKNVPNYYNNIGIALTNLNNNKEAIINYNKALKLNPNSLDTNINMGIAYKRLNNFEKSIKHFNFSLKISPNNYKIYNNIGNLLRAMGKIEDAIIAYDKSISINKENAEAYNNKAEIFLLKKDFQNAINFFEKTLSINPQFPYVYGKHIHAKMHICDWTDYEENIKYLKEGIKNNKKIIEPFPLLSLIDEMELQKRNALIFNETSFQSKVNQKLNKSINRGKKIKVGYFGAEFYNHPVLQLTQDIYKNHNKNNFEIYCFFHGPIKDESHFEIQKYFNKFYNINNKSDEEVINLCNTLDINIAINLTGYTSDSRNEIFLKKVAPIQISYVGYSGTMGTNFMDYIIGDKELIPTKYKKYYTEKVVNLPNSFFPNPSSIFISNKKFTKENLGIPPKSFVFGSFNNSYKITPIIFKAWMEILKKTDDSILWLLNNNDIASSNLRNECIKHKVDPRRVIFADKINYSEHLKRFEIMDLFLDTFPYNGHTTVAEAIRSKVPTVTIKGESFASRVATSILSAIKLSDLITDNLNDYISLAIELRNNKQKFLKIKKKLDNKETKILFDSKKYTKNLEDLFNYLIKKKS